MRDIDRESAPPGSGRFRSWRGTHGGWVLLNQASADAIRGGGGGNNGGGGGPIDPGEPPPQN